MNLTLQGLVKNCNDLHDDLRKRNPDVTAALIQLTAMVATLASEMQIKEAQGWPSK